MFINSIGYYVPKTRISNKYFHEINGLDEEWIVQRTGIHTRSKIAEGEDALTMGVEAVSDAIEKLPYDIAEVDLIISAGYTITDTVGTTAHRIQRAFNIEKAQAVAITSACSSFVNAVEIAEGYFAMQKASKALIICSEVNSVYNDYTNTKSGHLWGDGAVAVFVSKDRSSQDDPRIVDVCTKGLAHIGKGPDGVCLFPNKEGIAMLDGKDVFHYACTYMATTLEELLERNDKSVSDLDYISCHQANLRIVANVANRWRISESKFLNNIQELGNTGSASVMLALAQNLDKIQKGNLVGLTVFGGGYSSGAMLIRF